MLYISGFYPRQLSVINASISVLEISLIIFLRVAKRDYHDKKLTEYKSNVKNTWRILNEIINRHQRNLTRLPSTFRVTDREINDPVEIGNGFCDYFTNLGPSLAEKILTSNKPFSSFLKGDVVNSVFFTSTYQQKIVEICASLRSGSAAGFDNIHIDVVKQNIDIISNPLTHIINLSLSSGIVPKQLKIAGIIPLFKSGDQDLYANYRPVSTLTVFSKFLEKVVYKRSRWAQVHSKSLLVRVTGSTGRIFWETWVRIKRVFLDLPRSPHVCGNCNRRSHLERSISALSFDTKHR